MDNNKKNILIACDSSHTLLEFRGKLIEELVKRNNVAVFTPTISRQQVRDKLESLHVKVYENHLNGSNVSIFADLKYIFQLHKLIKETKPDVFFPYTFKPVIYGTMIAKICKVVCITPMLTGLGYNFSNNGTKNRLVSAITKILLKISLKGNKGIRIIFQNKDDYQKLLDSGIISLCS